MGQGREVSQAAREGDWGGNPRRIRDRRKPPPPNPSMSKWDWWSWIWDRAPPKSVYVWMSLVDVSMGHEGHGIASLSRWVSGTPVCQRWR